MNEQLSQSLMEIARIKGVTNTNIPSQWATTQTVNNNKTTTLNQQNTINNNIDMESFNRKMAQNIS
jgi:hypothetical protein